MRAYHWIHYENHLSHAKETGGQNDLPFGLLLIIRFYLGHHRHAATSLFERFPMIYSASLVIARYRKVTICALVQVISGLNTVSEVPLVMPLSTAHSTAL